MNRLPFRAHAVFAGALALVYFVLHLVMAGAVYGAGGLWTFFLVLLVPGFGDACGLWILTRSGQGLVLCALYAGLVVLLAFAAMAERRSVRA